jgi:hypothetical protein
MKRLVMITLGWIALAASVFTRHSARAANAVPRSEASTTDTLRSHSFSTSEGLT